MRIVKVTEPPAFTATCLTCEQVIPAGTLKYADLDGPAFKAYYHSTCIPTACELCGEPAGEGGSLCPACAESR